ncbi:MAG TPA: DUF3108 domain-containing protein [Gemmatimonadaceae bacterium]|nr:DUF3108 domain-containing protein [Gemmatimonadaceae bacterium]
MSAHSFALGARQTWIRAAVAAGLALGAAPLAAQSSAAPTAQPVAQMAPQPVAVDVGARQMPFSVGEELVYRAYFGGLPVGKARMRVDGIEAVRGRPAYHVVFSIDGGIPGFRVHDRYESWIDVATLSSLRYRQEISEGRYKKSALYEIYPEQGVYQKQGDTVRASVRDPLDEGSFIYAVRLAGVRAGETRRYDRYFRPDRNPVVLSGLRHETVEVGAGKFSTVVVRPTIRANGLFAENGDAQLWFTDDENRYLVQLKSHFSKFSLRLSLESVTPGNPAALPTAVAEAMAGQ